MSDFFIIFVVEETKEKILWQKEITKNLPI